MSGEHENPGPDGGPPRTLKGPSPPLHLLQGMGSRCVERPASQQGGLRPGVPLPGLLGKQEGAEAAASKSPERETEAEKGHLFSLMGPGLWALGLKLGP